MAAAAGWAAELTRRAPVALVPERLRRLHSTMMQAGGRTHARTSGTFSFLKEGLTGSPSGLVGDQRGCRNDA